MVDSSRTDEFDDDDKKNFFMNFILPEGMKILQNRLKVKSNQLIPAFDPVDKGCDDDGVIEIDSKYKTQTTDGDFLLFIGVVKNPSDGVLAYASSCLLGILILKNHLNFLN